MLSTLAQGFSSVGAMGLTAGLQRPVDAASTSSVLDQIKKDTQDKLAIEDEKKNSNKLIDAARFVTQMFNH
jgi:hypothetical protein